MWAQVLAFVCAAAILGFSLSTEPPEPMWVRLYGERPAPHAPLILRVEQGVPFALRKSPASTRVSLVLRDGAGHQQTQMVVFDEDGSKVVSFAAVQAGELFIQAQTNTTVLARGILQFASEPFAKRLLHRSGWFDGKQRGRTDFGTLRVGVRDGRLVLGRRTQLVIEFRSANGHRNQTILKGEIQGLTLANPRVALLLPTDENGNALLDVTPQDLSASLTLSAEDSGGQLVEFFAELPVEKAGFWGESKGSAIELVSLIPVPRLNYALVDELGIVARGSANLRCDGLARCRTTVAEQSVPVTPSWLVVGREPELDGTSAIGWPLNVSANSPQGTVQFRETRILDGKADAIAAHRRAVKSRAYVTLAGFVAVGVMFLVAVARRLLRPSARVDAVLDDEGKAILLPLHSAQTHLLLLLLLAASLLALGVWTAVRAFSR